MTSQDAGQLAAQELQAVAGPPAGQAVLARGLVAATEAVRRRQEHSKKKNFGGAICS